VAHKTKGLSKLVLDFFELLFIAVSIVLLTFIFLFQPLLITGDSMKPEFLDGEQIIAEKLTVKFQQIDRGEVLVVKHPKDEGVLVIKRVVGLPGETLMLVNSNIYIDGELLDESYLDSEVVTSDGNYLTEREEFQLSDSEYFMLGDNRAESFDSRFWGPVDKDHIVGRSILVYYPLKQFRIVQ